MDHLLSASRKFVVIYSSDRNQAGGAHARHVRHRNFSARVRERFPAWKLVGQIKNPYPGKGDFGQGSFADFFIFEKNGSS
jgi:hypothetical protein